MLLQAAGVPVFRAAEDAVRTLAALAAVGARAAGRAGAAAVRATA